MNKMKLTEVLTKRVLVCDGAMGTQLMAAGMKPGECGELWNVEKPDVVESIHRRYKDAGCDLVTTNTFGGCRTVLARHNAVDRCAELNRAAAEIASRVAGETGWALGNIGPFGDFLEPLGTTTADELTDIFAQQANALAEGGVDAFLIETMTDPTEMTIAIKAAKQVADLPILTTYAFDKAGDDLRTMMGATIADTISAAIDAGADVVGANCGTSLGMDDYRRLAEQLVAAADSTPVIIQPNAGTPRNDDGEIVYDAAADEMAQLARDMVSRGVRIVGGCCGTTPDLLRAMAVAVKTG